MKRLTTLLLTGMSLLLISTPVMTTHFWQIKMSTPASVINNRTFNLEYTTLSVEQDDDITVEAFQNNVSVSSQTTTKNFGDSGAFSITVPADGTYQYHLKATSSIDGIQTTETKSVTIDTVVPVAPSYGGVVRNGNQYTLTFSAPAGSDAVEARIYSSTSSNFTANASTQIGVVPIAPGETKTFTYTATTAQQRFHAVQLFDAAGNFSALRNDANVVVAQGQPAGGRATTSTASPAGTVAGAETDDSQVDPNAVATDDSGDVLGAEDKPAATDSKKASGKGWLWMLALLLAVGAVYYWLFYRRRDNQDSK